MVAAACSEIRILESFYSFVHIYGFGPCLNLILHSILPADGCCGKLIPSSWERYIKGYLESAIQYLHSHTNTSNLFRLKM